MEGKIIFLFGNRLNRNIILNANITMLAKSAFDILYNMGVKPVLRFIKNIFTTLIIPKQAFVFKMVMSIKVNIAYLICE